MVKKMEKVALEAYIDYHKNAGCDDVVVKKCGLVVSKEYPFLGASPDGIASCSTHGTRLIEIKCPYKARKSSVYNAPYMNKARRCIKSHVYKEQTLMQMALSNLKKCELFIWCKNDFHIEEYEFDVREWESLESSLVWYFKNVLLKKVLSE